MAQYRPFAIWDGESTLPSGIARNQNILIGEADQEYYNLGGFDWWAGPDESLGYVIAYYDPTFTHPNPLNIPCGIGFLRSSELTDASFLSKANQLRKGQSLSNLSNANDAKTWLLANGYWTSYGEAAWTYGNSIEGSGGGSTGTTRYWTAGTPNQPGEFAISANNTSNLELVTNILISTFAKDIDGINITDASSLFAGLSIGDNITLKPASQQAGGVTYVISSIQSTTGFGPNTYNIGVSHVSGIGSLYQTLWEIDFQ